MKISVRVGQSLESLGQSEWKRQAAQVDLGGEFPERVGIMLSPDQSPLAPGAYELELARAVQKQNVIVDGKRPGQKVSREMLVLDIRAQDLSPVKNVKAVS